MPEAAAAAPSLPEGAAASAPEAVTEATAAAAEAVPAPEAEAVFVNLNDWLQEPTLAAFLLGFPQSAWPEVARSACVLGVLGMKRRTASELSTSGVSNLTALLAAAQESSEKDFSSSCCSEDETQQTVFSSPELGAKDAPLSPEEATTVHAEPAASLGPVELAESVESAENVVHVESKETLKADPKSWADRLRNSTKASQPATPAAKGHASGQSEEPAAPSEPPAASEAGFTSEERPVTPVPMQAPVVQPVPAEPPQQHPRASEGGSDSDVYSSAASEPAAGSEAGSTCEERPLTPEAMQSPVLQPVPAAPPQQRPPELAEVAYVKELSPGASKSGSEHGLAKAMDAPASPKASVYLPNPESPWRLPDPFRGEKAQAESAAGDSAASPARRGRIFTPSSAAKTFTPGSPWVESDIWGPFTPVSTAGGSDLWADPWGQLTPVLPTDDSERWGTAFTADFNTAVTATFAANRPPLPHLAPATAFPPLTADRPSQQALVRVLEQCMNEFVDGIFAEGGRKVVHAAKAAPTRKSPSAGGPGTPPAGTPWGLPTMETVSE